MKKFIMLSLLLATPTFADSPTTVILPVQLVAAIQKYLSDRPYSEVAQLLGVLQSCIAVQVPDQKGVSHGECPPVTEALHKSDKAKK